MGELEVVSFQGAAFLVSHRLRRVNACLEVVREDGGGGRVVEAARPWMNNQSWMMMCLKMSGSAY